MKTLKLFSIIILTSTLFLACGKTDLIYDPFPDGALHKWSGTWVIYEDKLNTGGGVGLWTWGSNMTFGDVEESPYSGKKCFKFSWNGGPLSYWTGSGVGTEDSWAGLAFLCGSDYDHNYSKNISAGGYNKVVFYARAELSPGRTVSFNALGSSLSDITVPSTWTQYILNLTPSQLTNVTTFFSIVIGGGSGKGPATVYVDKITFVKLE